MKCRICGSLKGTRYTVREMMYGSKQEFPYFQCDNCCCLQIENYPENMFLHYPEDYYSKKSVVTNENWKTSLKLIRNKSELSKQNILGSVLKTIKPNQHLRKLAPFFSDRGTSILDVGCGAGHLLHLLKECGFNHTHGIDPYIEQNIRYENGLTIEKKFLDDMNEAWDIIMMHHSLEHMPNQFKILSQLEKLLSDKGLAIIRIPIVNKYAWREFGVDWFQIDAPRHFYLHSIESMKLLAEQVGLKVTSIVYDSTELQLTGSLGYQRGIPLVNQSVADYSRFKRYNFYKKAKQLNEEGEGDQCMFVLQK